MIVLCVALIMLYNTIIITNDTDPVGTNNHFALSEVVIYDGLFTFSHSLKLHDSVSEFMTTSYKKIDKLGLLS